MSKVFLNQSHVDTSNSSMTTMRMNLGAGVNLSGYQVALANISVFNSTFNISSALGNNSFSIGFPNGASSYALQTFTISNGCYSVAQLDALLQGWCLTLGWYLVGASGSNYYFMEFVTNSAQYAIQLNVYPVPTTLPTGYTLPTSGTMLFTLPTGSIRSPSFSFNQAFGNLVGLSSSIASVTTSTSIQNFVSTFTPKLNVVSCYMMSCNLVNNKLNTNASVLAQIPLIAGFGSLINYNPCQLVFCDCIGGMVNQVVIQFYDQNNVPLLLNDNQICIELLLTAPPPTK